MVTLNLRETQITLLNARTHRSGTLNSFIAKRERLLYFHELKRQSHLKATYITEKVKFIYVELQRLGTPSYSLSFQRIFILPV